MVCAKMNIPADLTSFELHFHSEGETSSNSQTFQPHKFQRDLRLLHVDVNKFYGSYPTGWVTQMEDYLSLYGITDELARLWYGVLHLYQERFKWRKMPSKGMWLGHNLWKIFMKSLTLIPTIYVA
jgi:hypothetical protein